MVSRHLWYLLVLCALCLLASCGGAEPGSESTGDGDSSGAAAGGAGSPAGVGGALGEPGSGGSSNGSGGGSTVGSGGLGAGTGGDGGVRLGPTVPLHRTFEATVENTNSYANKFTDVELQVTYTSPSGRTIEFFGFFDGDGDGGGDADSGDVWKLRFLPNELGQWTYSYTWSDGTPGGEGAFFCAPEGAGKGILRAYEQNPRWFAYEGTEPVWIKSYYETSVTALAQPFDWVSENVYQPLIDRGYNHLQVNWLFPLCCHHLYYHDGPEPSLSEVPLYSDGEVTTSMRLDVWQLLEARVAWLDERNVGLHMFIGFNGGRNGGPDWKSLSDEEQEFYVKYVVARLAPYANIAGWNYVWEVAGDDAEGELELATLLERYDIFDHLRTYEDEEPGDHEFDRPQYTFAAVENHGFSEKTDWDEAWTHHAGALAGYVPGKPVYMAEGNALWRWYWKIKLENDYGGVTVDDGRRAAWAVATAGASFVWNGHQPQADVGLVTRGADGLPFFGDNNPYNATALAVDILSDVMTGDVEFFSMHPADHLLSNHNDRRTWALAEEGRQYLVFSTGGDSFNLRIASGNYTESKWVDTKTGASTPIDSIFLGSEETRSFSPPNSGTDWVLVLRD